MQGLILTLLVPIKPERDSAESVRLAKSAQGRSHRAEQLAKPPITLVSESATTNMQMHTHTLYLVSILLFNEMKSNNQPGRSIAKRTEAVCLVVFCSHCCFNFSFIHPCRSLSSDHHQSIWQHWCQPVLYEGISGWCISITPQWAALKLLAGCGAGAALTLCQSCCSTIFPLLSTAVVGNHGLFLYGSACANKTSTWTRQPFLAFNKEKADSLLFWFHLGLSEFYL